ncbi:MAG: hypothetical protein H6722_30750 [Sandaracinus sp.]|nr:hypothetical protein [Sandaracinus sp.]
MIRPIDDVDVEGLPVGALIPRRAPLSLAALRVRLRSWEQLDRDYAHAPLDEFAREAMRVWLDGCKPEPLFRDHVFVDARGHVLVFDEESWNTLLP